MLFSRLRQAATLTKSTYSLTQTPPSTLDSSPSTTNEPTKSSTSITPFPINRTSSSPQPDPATSETTSISRLPSITGLTKTGSTMSTKPISDAPRSTCSVQSTMPPWPTLAVSTQSQSSAGSTAGPGTTGIPISKSISPKSLPERFFRSSGTEPLSLSEDSLLRKSTRKTTSILKPLFLIKSAKSA